jgi:hypothetical protein
MTNNKKSEQQTLNMMAKFGTTYSRRQFYGTAAAPNSATAIQTLKGASLTGRLVSNEPLAIHSLISSSNEQTQLHVLPGIYMAAGLAVLPATSGILPSPPNGSAEKNLLHLHATAMLVVKMTIDAVKDQAPASSIASYTLNNLPIEVPLEQVKDLIQEYTDCSAENAYLRDFKDLDMHDFQSALSSKEIYENALASLAKAPNFQDVMSYTFAIVSSVGGTPSHKKVIAALTGYSKEAGMDMLWNKVAKSAIRSLQGHDDDVVMTGIYHAVENIPELHVDKRHFASLGTMLYNGLVHLLTKAQLYHGLASLVSGINEAGANIPSTYKTQLLAKGGQGTLCGYLSLLQMVHEQGAHAEYKRRVTEITDAYREAAILGVAVQSSSARIDGKGRVVAGGKVSFNHPGVKFMYRELSSGSLQALKSHQHALSASLGEAFPLGCYDCYSGGKFKITP